jgi:hypothetical protein
LWVDRIEGGGGESVSNWVFWAPVGAASPHIIQDGSQELEDPMKSVGTEFSRSTAKTPYNRISFYYGGDRLIRFLTDQYKTVMRNIELLYSRIFGTQQ